MSGKKQKLQVIKNPEALYIEEFKALEKAFRSNCARDAELVMRSILDPRIPTDFADLLSKLRRMNIEFLPKPLLQQMDTLGHLIYEAGYEDVQLYNRDGTPNGSVYKRPLGRNRTEKILKDAPFNACYTKDDADIYDIVKQAVLEDTREALVKVQEWMDSVKRAPTLHAALNMGINPRLAMMQPIHEDILKKAVLPDGRELQWRINQKLDALGLEPKIKIAEPSRRRLRNCRQDSPQNKPFRPV